MLGGCFICKVGRKPFSVIDILLLLPAMQINEDGLKLISTDNDTNCIGKFVREGHKYLMFYLDHDGSYGGGGWDDDVANPYTHVPPMIGPTKRKTIDSTSEQSIVVQDNTADMMYACERNVQRSSRSTRRGTTKENGESSSESDSDDSDYDPELVDSDYDLEVGDVDLVNEDAYGNDEKKGRTKGNS